MIERTSGAGGDASEGEETDLVARLRAGDEAAFEQLVRETAGRMLSVARRYLKRESEAEDAVQEAFLSAFRNIDRFAGDSRIATWLHRITVNAALMRLRSRRRRPEESIEDLLPGFLEDGHMAEPAARWRVLPDAQLGEREIRDVVQAAIDRLPDSYRHVLMLRDIEGLDTAEAAAALGVSENAVKTRLHRARQALRGLLEPHFREAE